MTRTDYVHVLIAALAAVMGVGSFLLEGPLWVPIVVVCGINLYLVCALVLVAVRAIPLLPDRAWSVVELVFLLVAIVCAFANMYVDCQGVVHVVRDLDTERPAVGEDHRELLTNKFDACYFSTVTFTTVGFGDYVPANSLARGIVVWELGTGLLFLVLALPLVVSRLADFH